MWGNLANLSYTISPALWNPASARHRLRVMQQSNTRLETVMSDTTTTVTRRWTVADLEDLPDDGNRYEIIDGALHVTSAPHTWHQIIVHNLDLVLGVWNLQTGVGLTIPGPGVIFSPSDAVIPDLVWVRRDRFADLLGEDGKLHAAPDLAVEVLSEGKTNEERDRTIKRRQYGDWGVREYWIVDRFARTVEVYRLAEGTLQLAVTLGENDELTSPLLPGFVCPVAALFVDLPA